MKTIRTPRYDLFIATHTGMCFGVRQALAATETLLSQGRATVLGQLAHNPAVSSRLEDQGASSGQLADRSAPTRNVVITAHGASDRDRKRWREAGYQVTDTTCPLVHVAHRKLADLVARGCQPVIIGKEGHVEVQGLQGDFPGAEVLLHPDEIVKIPQADRIGIISQTTQPIHHVRALVSEIRKQRPHAEIHFHDTVCHPTKDRQSALEELCRTVDLVLAIGGKNSNNTAQLARTSRQLGCRAYHVVSPDDLREKWFKGVRKIGLTAGTSTLDESLEAVIERLQEMAGVVPPPRHAASTH